MRKRNSATGEGIAVIDLQEDDFPEDVEGNDHDDREPLKLALRWQNIIQEAIHTHRDEPRVRNAAIAFLIFLLLYIIAMQDANEIIAGPVLVEFDKDSRALDLGHLKECTVKAPPKHQIDKIKDIKPLLFAQYPAAIPDIYIRALVGALTGLELAAKAFYAQNNVYRQCRPRNPNHPAPTAACMLIHPTIDAGDLTNKKWTDNYHQKTVFSMRNPAMNIPAYLNEKAIKYGGLKGQQPQEKWREARDEWGLNMLQSWEKSIYAWRNHSTHFENPFYFTYEDLMDPTKGPIVVKGLADLLKGVGYSEVPTNEEDLRCIWYQSIGNEQLEHYHKTHYDLGYDDYTPGWTKSQKKHMVASLRKLGESFAEDAALVNIIQEYVQKIERETRLDVAAAANKSSNAAG